MDSPKVAASLTGGLLARKGLARPAMRRQPVVVNGPRAVSSLDDLGWNDMGEDAVAPAPQPVPSQVAKHIAAIQDTLAQRRVEVGPEAKEAKAKITEPKVAAIAAAVAAAAPVAVSAPVSNIAPARSKSAFTLRIDAERHLRLRLLSAVVNQSAQTLLIGALDALIAQYPDIDALAADPKARGTMDDTDRQHSGMEQGT
jgi:hypothetical protein